MIADQLLITATEAYEEALLETLPEEAQCTHLFSSHFQRKIKKLCRQVKCSAVRTWSKRIAGIIVALVFLTSMLLIFNADARATVVDWLKESYGGYVSYFFAGEQQESTEPRTYEITDLPEGYILLDQMADSDGGFTIYVNRKGEYLNLEFLTYTDPGMLFLAVEEYNYSCVMADGIKMEVYTAKNPRQANSIVWVSGYDVLFHISANADVETLIGLAKSVAETKK